MFFLEIHPNFKLQNLYTSLHKHDFFHKSYFLCRVNIYTLIFNLHLFRYSTYISAYPNSYNFATSF